MTTGRRTKTLVVRIPTVTYEGFHRRYPLPGSARVLITAAMRAAILYPDLAHRLMREYTAGSLVDPETETEARPA